MIKRLCIGCIVFILCIGSSCFANIVVDIKGKSTIVSKGVDYSQLDTNTQSQLETQLKIEPKRTEILFGPGGMYLNTNISRKKGNINE